ncbi:hypothetical protein L202_07116 [Cryptococcus amylolentus CBS 6039]|uniref:Uncharacterized protein n=1 Tax=Cryptococcus amylolentus CBS 6039 TaxID=1295533 RepID=A0A1E3HHB1_9TREE|nr:hypothetical protein L202_07116 [Cryptococcus amylolentus CBS 6039]ODN74801.1 hypothetical protein L202_07116 [Cryptococcus amylolentus CBS 6039]
MDLTPSFDPSSVESKPVEAIRVEYTCWNGVSGTRYLKTERDMINHWPSLIISRNGDTNSFLVNAEGTEEGPLQGTFKVPCDDLGELGTILDNEVRTSMVPLSEVPGDGEAETAVKGEEAEEE